MPARAKGARLWLRPERRDQKTGRTSHAAVWVIRDGEHQESTGCPAYDVDAAERALATYVATKHARAAAGQRNRHPSTIPVADILTLYLRSKVSSQARPHETKLRIKALTAFFGDKMLSAVNGEACREYAKGRSQSAARRELEDLRAAINHHRKEGLCSEIVEIVLPDAGIPRDRWLTRQEAAALVLAAWRYREKQNLRGTDRRTRRHIARFILVGLYTGTRAAAICGAAFQPTEGRGWIDLERGVFYRRGIGVRETKKRQTPVPLPHQLLAHLRRWKRQGQKYVVEWNGKPVRTIKRAFKRVAEDAGLGDDVTPHVLRHTAATWIMQAGTDPWQAAGYLAMTLELLIERYGHHHPDHLGGARRSFSKHRQAVARPVAKIA